MIVVFDGECGLCNGFVAWLLRRDRDGAFLLAGSNGEVGRAVIEAAGLPIDVGDSTIVLARPGEPALTRSDAVLAILSRLRWHWRAAAVVARIVPRRLRDRVYRAIATRRPRVEADDPACGVPPPELLALWRSRLATMDDAARLSQGTM